jgi:hypothetical protein
MKLSISVLGAWRGESGGRRQCGEALGCSRRPFIRVEAESLAVWEELDCRRQWVLMTFSMLVTGLKIEGNGREGDRMERRLGYLSGEGRTTAWHGGARRRSVDL